MDFFAQQDAARRKTGLLVVAFVVCVVAIIVSVYFSVLGFSILIQKDTGWRPHGVWHPRLMMGVSAATILLVLVGSLKRLLELSKGGIAVAQSLGATRVAPETQDPKERCLLNVVEEIAIASGIPVPPVYLIRDQKGINAFAAGLSPSTAVVAVTAGSLEHLTRDELQGVIAHEFSHIAWGDMRLNLRLMGVIAGILSLSIVGRTLLRVRGKKNPIPLLGLALFLIGLIGVFFARLIKAAVSRQREFLADASAVQFTRNPAGIGGALKKIGGCFSGSRIDHPRAEEASHLYFAHGLRGSFTSLLETHPRLDERIRRIDPAFDGRFPQVRATVAEETARALWGGPPKEPPKMAAALGSIMASIGVPNSEHLIYAASLLASMPQEAARATRSPQGARAAIFALLMSREAGVQRAQFSELDMRVDRDLVEATHRLLPIMQSVGPQYQLPLVELAQPVLRGLSRVFYEQFCEAVAALIDADHQVDLFEFMLERILVHDLEMHFRKASAKAVRYNALGEIRQECAIVLAALSRIGQRDEQAAARAFAKGRGQLGTEGAALAFPPEAPLLAAVGTALEKLAATAPQVKKTVVEMCTACVVADGIVTVEEGELLRAVTAVLDCPMPPLLPGNVAGLSA